MIDRPVSFCSNNPVKTRTPAVNALPRFSLIRSASRLLVTPFIAAVIALCPIETHADTTALSFTPSGTTIFGGAGSDTFGWGFSLSSPLVVTQLGVWDENGDGLGQSHLVTIWDSTGSPVAQVTVPSGTGPETNGFRYVSIGSLTLAAGNYTIGAFYNAFGSDVASASASAISTAPGVTYAGSRTIAGNAFPPTDALALPDSYFGPNFQFTTTSSIPDTGMTASLLGLSLTGLAFLRRKLC
jgi:hypothetical protein